MPRTWMGVDRRLGRGKSSLWIGVKIFYVWLIQSLALAIGLTICLALVRDLGGWFSTMDYRMLVAGTVIGFSVSSYRLMKQRESWNIRGAELEAEIRRLAKLAGVESKVIQD